MKIDKKVEAAIIIGVLWAVAFSFTYTFLLGISA